MFQLCQQQQQQAITIGINSVNVHDLYNEKKTYKLKRSIRDLTKTTAIGIPKKQWVLLTEQMICFVLFVLLCSVLFFLTNFFAVAAQLRREMTKFLVYLA